MSMLLRSMLVCALALLMSLSQSTWGSDVDVAQSGDANHNTAVYRVDERLSLDVTSDMVIGVSTYALAELQKLSESRIYDTLSIDRVIKADQQDGIYHTNYILTIDLKSEHFESDMGTERYEFIVMKHMEDNVTSFAINEFPRMKEKKIEEFYIKKVKAKVIEKEDTILRLRVENLFFDHSLPEGVTDVYDYDKNAKIKIELDKKTVRKLLSEIDTPQLQASREENSKRFIRQLTGELADRESTVSAKSLEDLYSVLTGGSKFDDFDRYRAQQLIDLSLQLLSQRVS